jgi:3'-phosphoadenosine 5'-phosphosulfate sulfotransferase (PAPS reductase)/FAD synthetase
MQLLPSIRKPFPATSAASPEILRSHFERLLKKVRRKEGYDCLVPISGGKDSMYALYLLAGVYKLNVLAYNFDNGFQSEKAAQNIQKGVKKYGVDLVIYKPGKMCYSNSIEHFSLGLANSAHPAIWRFGPRQTESQGKTRFALS